MEQDQQNQPSPLRPIQSDDSVQTAAPDTNVTSDQPTEPALNPAQTPAAAGNGSSSGSRKLIGVGMIVLALVILAVLVVVIF